MTEAMKEAIWLQELLADLGIDQDLLKINCDSMSAIYMAKNQVYHVRMKHIDVRFRSVWEILDKGNIELKKILTKENLADKCCFRSKVRTLQGVTLYSFSCLSSVELVWMNYGWLDSSSRGYVSNHIGAAQLSQHGGLLCLAQILRNLHRGGELRGESVKSY